MKEVLAKAGRVAWIGVAVSLLVSGCAGMAAAPTPAATASSQGLSVRVAKASVGTLSAVATYSGSVSAKSKVAITPKVSGRVEELNADVGSALKKGDVIAVIDSDVAETQVAQAEAALVAAQAKLQVIEDGPRAETVAQAEANAKAAAEKVESLRSAARPESIAQAEANLNGAKAKLDQLNKGATTEQVNAAKLAVDQARNSLMAAQANRDGVCGNGRVPRYNCDAAEAQVNAAQTAVDQAQAQLAIVTAAPTAEQVAQAQAAVDAATEQLELAKKPVNTHDLAQAEAAAEAASKAAELAKNPFTDNDRKMAEAGVEQTQAALDAARIGIEEATIVAPFDGIVAQRMLSVGGMAAPTSPIVSMVSSNVEVIINVEESRLSRVAVGQSATISVAAYPGEELPGKIVSIAPILDERSRATAVRIVPETPGKLLDGMFAQVKIAGAERSGVLLAPLAAVSQKQGRTIVFVAKDGHAEERDVKTGGSDGTNVEVTAGLADGEDVIVSNLDSLTSGQTISAVR